MACMFAWRRGFEEKVQAKGYETAGVETDEPGQVNWQDIHIVEIAREAAVAM